MELRVLAPTLVLLVVAVVVVIAAVCANEDVKDALLLPCLKEPTAFVIDASDTVAFITALLVNLPWLFDGSMLDSGGPRLPPALVHGNSLRLLADSARILPTLPESSEVFLEITPILALPSFTGESPFSTRRFPWRLRGISALAVNVGLQVVKIVPTTKVAVKVDQNFVIVEDEGTTNDMNICCYEILENCGVSVLRKESCRRE